MAETKTKKLNPAKHLRPKDYDFNLLYDKPLDNKYRIKFPHKLDRRSQKISCIEDSMFKTLIFSNERLKYSCRLLSELLDISYEELKENLKLDKNALDKLKKRDKNQNVDYVGRIYDTYINIEMTNSQKEKYMKRNFLYATSLLNRNNKEGIDDYEATKLQIIQIAINNYAFLDFCDTMYIHTVNDRNSGLDRFDNIIVIEIFLPNIVRKWKEEGVEALDYLERLLLVYMLYNIKDCKKIGKGDEFMEKFIKDAKKASKDDYLLAAYDKEEETRDAIREQAIDEGKSIGLAEGKSLGKAEGIEQGIKRGKSEEKIATAKKLYESNVSMDIIKNVTGFSAKQIRNICL